MALNYLPLVAFAVARERQQLLSKHLFPSISTNAFQLPEILGAARDLEKVDGWAKNLKEGV